MNRNFSLLLAAGALAAYLVNPLFAGQKTVNDDKIIYLKSGDMIIPFHGEGGDEVVVSYGTPVLDEEGNAIGLRRMLLNVAIIIHIPALGIEDWAITGTGGAVDIDFYGGDPYLLKFWTSPALDYQILDEDDPNYAPPPAHGEAPLQTSTYGIHRMTSDTMTEKYITSSNVFSNGPLAGVVMTQVEHVVEPLVDPPAYASAFTGFLYVPAHIDLEVVKQCAKKGKKAKRRFRR
jgi:hypothetical protein